EKCIELMADDAPYAPTVYQILCSAFIDLGHPEDAMIACDEAEERGCGSILNAFERAHACFELGRNGEALESIDQCLDMEWPYELVGDFGIKTHKGLVLKGQILTVLGLLDEAEAALTESASIDPDFSMGLFARAR